MSMLIFAHYDKKKGVRKEVNILRSMGRDGFIYLFIIEYGKKYD